MFESTTQPEDLEVKGAIIPCPMPGCTKVVVWRRILVKTRALTE